MKRITLLLSLLSVCFPAFCQDIPAEGQLIGKTIGLYSDGWAVGNMVNVMTRTPHTIDDAYAEAARRVDSLFASYNSHTPGAAVAIVKDGKVVFRKGYGMADLEHDIPVTPQTVFNIASVSKQFTAFAIY